MKKGNQSIPALDALRDMCGEFREWQPRETGWKQIRPGLLRKAYGAGLPKGRWFYIPAVLEARHKRRDVPEIAQLIDTRSITELGEQAHSATEPRNQLLYRAHHGDDKALALFARLARESVDALASLARFEPERVRRIAATYPEWPVLLSLNPQDVRHTKEALKELTVGSQALTPTRANQKVDPRNFWTRLALAALDACDRARKNTPPLQEHAKAAVKRLRQLRRFWGVRTHTTFYFLANGDAIIITDWHKKCARLAKPITAANFAQWWKAVKLCVLHHWQNSGGDYDLSGSLSYAEALRSIGQPQEEAWRRRSLALDRLQQAFRSRVGLQ